MHEVRAVHALDFEHMEIEYASSASFLFTELGFLYDSVGRPTDDAVYARCAPRNESLVFTTINKQVMKHKNNKSRNAATKPSKQDKEREPRTAPEPLAVAGPLRRRAVARPAPLA